MSKAAKGLSEGRSTIAVNFPKVNRGVNESALLEATIGTQHIVVVRQDVGEEIWEHPGRYVVVRRDSPDHRLRPHQLFCDFLDRSLMKGVSILEDREFLVVPAVATTGREPVDEALPAGATRRPEEEVDRICPRQTNGLGAFDLFRRTVEAVDYQDVHLLFGQCELEESESLLCRDEVPLG